MTAHLTSARAPQEELEHLKATRLKGLTDRESNLQEQRARLRDSVVQMREPEERPVKAPASQSNPSFLIGDNKGFKGVLEPGTVTPGPGHLNGQASKDFLAQLKEAASKPDIASREAGVGRAADIIARDLTTKHRPPHTKDDLVSAVLHEARTQAVFTSQEIGKKLGLGAVESSIIGYSLERALEAKGIKVIANHAVDMAAEGFKSTASSVAAAAGMRHSSESALSKSFNWMAEKGVTREALKDALGKHAGKLVVINEVAHNPEALQRVAHTIAKSDTALHAVMAISKDAELRQSIGTLAIASGESLVSVNKAVGSIAIVGGAALRGDSMEDTGRHAFRAAMAVAGGAAGGLVGAGFLSVATGTAGAVGGSALADKILDLYDKHLGPQPPTAKLASKQEVHDSAATVVNKLGEAYKPEQPDKEKSLERVRTMSLGTVDSRFNS